MIPALTMALALASDPPALAQGQRLLPTPFPQTLGGNAAPLDPRPFTGSRHQRLNADPYPQTLGANAQGNPPIARRYRHQRLVPSVRKRKYRVDW
ncbi:MAG: hypothetical protein JOZ16_03680 [Methylobacteriaceae bacterium]|nr:hypothetical protein [Methylobacteriaceae bacterium]